MKFRNRSGWTAVPNALFEDSTLSSEGVRLIGWLLTHTGEFEIRRDKMMKALSLTDYKLRSAIKEAKGAGYLRTITQNCPVTGKLQSRYEISTDSRFTTSGESTIIRTLIKPLDLTDFEREFLSIFPSEANDWSKFRDLLSKVQREQGNEKVIGWATEYAQEVNGRTRGGRISKPENFLWRKLYPEYDEVIEKGTDASARSAEPANHETLCEEI